MELKAINLVKKFKLVEAISEVSIDVKEGELFTLLGPSGCGKTTLLRLIAGFYEPDEGEIYFDGRLMNYTLPYQRQIAIVFQNYALWPHMTVYNNIAYGLKIKKLHRNEINMLIGETLEKLGLEELQDRYPKELSGGQQQRVALARALVLKPQILLLDEPLSNLDAKVRVQVRAEIRKLQQELKITTLYVTHDQEEALTLSDRIAVMAKGKVEQIDIPMDLYEKPKNKFVANFIGTNNIIEAVVKNIDNEKKQGSIDTQIGELIGTFDEKLMAGKKCIACIRPENISIHTHPIRSENGNIVEGEISFRAYLGNILRYDIETSNRFILKVDIKDLMNHKIMEIGDKVFVTLNYLATRLIDSN